MAAMQWKQGLLGLFYSPLQQEPIHNNFFQLDKEIRIQLGLFLNYS